MKVPLKYEAPAVRGVTQEASGLCHMIKVIEGGEVARKARKTQHENTTDTPKRLLKQNIE